MPALARQWQLPFPLDVLLVLSVHRRGGGDPAYAVDPAGAVWRTSLTPDGPGTLRVLSRSAEVPGSTLVTGQAWGPGAGWLLDHVPAQLGGQDDRSGVTGRDAGVPATPGVGAYPVVGLAPGRGRGRPVPHDHHRRRGRRPDRGDRRTGPGGG